MLCSVNPKLSPDQAHPIIALMRYTIMSVWNVAKSTAVASLTTVSAAAQSITHAADSISALTETAALYATNYRDDAKEELAVTSIERRTLRVNTARVNLAEELRKLEKKLASDPELRAVYDSLSTTFETPKLPTAA